MVVTVQGLSVGRDYSCPPAVLAHEGLLMMSGLTAVTTLHQRREADAVARSTPARLSIQRFRVGTGEQPAALKIASADRRGGAARV